MSNQVQTLSRATAQTGAVHRAATSPTADPLTTGTLGDPLSTGATIHRAAAGKGKKKGGKGARP